MSEIRRGEIWWVDLPSEIRASEPAFRRPVVVVQDDFFNKSKLATIIVIALTARLELADQPGNVLLSGKDTGLKRDSVANVSALFNVDRVFFDNPGYPLGKLRGNVLQMIDEGLKLVLSL